MSAQVHYLSIQADALYLYFKGRIETFNGSGLDYKVLGAAVISLAILYPLGTVIHNLFFSPIAKFPGPKLAAATGLYEFYYDFFHSGRYIFEIEKMHAIYG
jgi:hypothetical protein